MKEANQAVYDSLFIMCQKLGYDVYNYLPDTAKYPFVYIGEQFDEPVETKGFNDVIGTSITTIRIYGEKEKRNVISTMLGEIKKKAKQIDDTFGYKLSYRKSTPKLLQEKSDGVFLWHGIIEIEINYRN